MSIVRRAFSTSTDEAAMTAGIILLNSKVLVLNRGFLPVHITSLRRAFSLLYQGLAQAVDDQYQTFDFRQLTKVGGDR